MRSRFRIAMLLLLACVLIAACAVGGNLQDGYQPGDVAQGLIDDKRAYCSAPYRGVRAVGRMIIAFLGGVTVPNPCAIIDAVIEAKAEKVLPGTP